MSRIGNKVINIPEGVNVAINGSVVTVKGAKGETTVTLNQLVYPTDIFCIECR